MGVGDSDTVESKLMGQLPVIKQINEEFRDPVRAIIYSLCVEYSLI